MSVHSLGCFFFVAAYLLPIGLSLGVVGDKPIDLVLSDFAWFVLAFLLMVGSRVDRGVLRTWLVFLYFPALALFSSLLKGGDLAPVLSGFRFFAPTVHLFAGYLLYKKYGETLFRSAGVVLGFVFFVMLLSDVFLGSFPRGCGYEGRWGGCFFNYEIYGFPNSSASFLSLVSVVFLFFLVRAESAKSKAFFLVLVFLVFVMAALSLSRAALLVSFLLLLSAFLMAFPVRVLFFLIPAAGLLFFVFFDFLFESFIFAGTIDRTRVAIEHGDVSTGRFDIWWHTLGLVSQSPLFGYMFDFFSNYSVFGTPHQQYLEILFKSGILGFLIYYGFFAFVVLGCFKVFAKRSVYVGVRAVFAIFVFLVLLNSAFQPILSYQPMANLVFCLAGIFFCYSKSEVAK